MGVVGAGNGAGGTAAVIITVFLAAAGLLLYFVPLIVAAARHVRNLGSVAVINVFAGWTVIGWVVALALACRTQDPVSRSASG